MNKNHKTLDVDQLFVRNIIFKDFSNRPISSNQFLTTRGDGAIYFSDQSTTTARAFVEVQAEDIRIPATTTSNTLFLGAGAGIQYYSTSINGGINKKLYITATAPEQIIAGSQKLHFSTLRDDPVGGRSLYFAGSGDTTVNISDTTVVFGSVYNSSYGSLSSTISTSEALLAQQSSLMSTINGSMSSVIDAISSLDTSTITDLSETILNLSTFVWSTFAQDTSGNHTILNIDTINSKNINVSTIHASTAQIGHTLITDSNYLVGQNSTCSAITSNGVVNTVGSYMMLSDDSTGVVFGFDKESLKAYSTINGSTVQTFAKLYQLGNFAQYSTLGSGNFIPIIEQVEVIEQYVTSSFNGVNWVSTIETTNYINRATGKFDEICSASGELIIKGNVSISTLTVSTINGLTGGVGINSTISTFYVSSLWGKNVSISSGQISSVQIINADISSAVISSLLFTNASGQNLSVNTISTNHLTASNGTFESISSSKLSTCELTFCSASGNDLKANIISTNVISTGVLNVGVANISTVQLCDITFCHASGESLSTLLISTGSIQAESGEICDLTFCHAHGSSISTLLTSTGALYASSIQFVNSRGSNITFSNGDASTISVSSLTFLSSVGNSLETKSLSTSQLVFEKAVGSSITTFTTSTGQLRFGYGTASTLDSLQLSTGTLYFNNAYGESLSTTYISSAQIQTSSIVGISATFSSIHNSSIYSEFSKTSTSYISSLYSDYVSTGKARIGELDTNCISAICVSTGLLSWGAAQGSTMNVLNGNISTLTLSTVMGVDAPIFTFDMTNRRVGLNLGPTQQPRATFDVSGIVYANNFVTTSDRRLKHSIHEYDLDGVDVKTYKYINENGESDIGVMADEIEQFAPECVYTRPDGYKAVSYTKLVPVCLTLIRSLSERIAKLEEHA